MPNTYLIEIELPPGSNVSKAAISSVESMILNDIKPLVEDIFREAIRDAVYSSYSPTTYLRRYDLLSSFSSSVSGGELSMSSTASSNLSWETGTAIGGSNAFLSILTNPGRLWHDGFPRPASETFYQDKVDNDPRIEAAIEACVMKYVYMLF